MTKEAVIEEFRKLPPESKSVVLEVLRLDCQISTARELMTDAEVCDALRISINTLRNHIKNGPPKKCGRACGDIRTIKTVSVGAKRFWPRAAVQAFIDGN
jgi:hypothetical protein